MMKEITVSAKTLDDAITEASIQLGVSSDQMEYDVIEKGSTGFFGIGSKQAVLSTRKDYASNPWKVMEYVFSGIVTPVYSEDEHPRRFRQRKSRIINRDLSGKVRSICPESEHPS